MKNLFNVVSGVTLHTLSLKGFSPLWHNINNKKMRKHSRYVYSLMDLKLDTDPEDAVY